MRLPRATVSLLALLAASPALAQSSLLQGGPHSAGHLPMYVGPQTQPIVQDGGGAGGGGLGINPSEIGITSRSPTGLYPSASSGNGPLGEHSCMYDGPTTNASGYHYLCTDPNANGGGLIDYGAAGGATAEPLYFVVNGTTYSFPFTVGGILGPSTSNVGDLALWNNTTGNVLKALTPGTGVASALGNPVNASGGFLSYGLIGTSGATIPLNSANNTTSGNNTHSGAETFSANPQFSGCVGYAYSSGAAPESCSPYIGLTTGLNVNGTSTFSSIFYDNASSFSPYELVIQNNIGGNNVLQIRNTNVNGFAAISFRGNDPFDADPTAVYERGAIGWSNSGIFALEISSYDNTSDPGKPPSRFSMQQAGGVDPTGGVTQLCNLSKGSTTITCPFNVPAYASNLYVYSFNLPYDTQIQSGFGTTTPTLNHAALATQVNATVRFWYPSFLQRAFFSASADDGMWFSNFDGSFALLMNRAEHNIGIYGGVMYNRRQLTGSTTSDTATIADNFILWDATATSAKAETIPACVSSIGGMVMTIVDEANTAATYNIVVTPAAGQIEFGSSKSITTNGGSLRVMCDGAANWTTY